MPKKVEATPRRDRKAAIRLEPKAFFVYLARCADRTLYTGIARDVEARIAAHNSGRGARYARGRTPLVLAALVRCKSQGDALRLESAIKKLRVVDKLKLLEHRGLASFARSNWKAQKK